MLFLFIFHSLGNFRLIDCQLFTQFSSSFSLVLLPCWFLLPSSIYTSTKIEHKCCNLQQVVSGSQIYQILSDNVYGNRTCILGKWIHKVIFNIQCQNYANGCKSWPKSPWTHNIYEVDQVGDKNNEKRTWERQKWSWRQMILRVGEAKKARDRHNKHAARVTNDNDGEILWLWCDDSYECVDGNNSNIK